MNYAYGLKIDMLNFVPKNEEEVTPYTSKYEFSVLPSKEAAYLAEQLSFEQRAGAGGFI